MKKGKFIVLYGINNLGKTTQLNLLVEYLKNTKGRDVHSLKVPVYNLAPTGPAISEYLRGGNSHGLSAREAQLLYAMNRTHFASQLEELLQEKDFVIAEDYFGTSFAWGMGAGVSKEFLYEMNSHLRIPDISILLDGERFLSGIEIGHKHETDDELTKKVRQTHLDLGKELGWRMVNANQPIEKVHEEIAGIVEEVCG